MPAKLVRFSQEAREKILRAALAQLSCIQVVPEPDRRARESGMIAVWVISCSCGRRARMT